MLFGEREDDFSEELFLDEKHRSEDMSKFETIIGARNAVTGNIEGASPICINGKLIGNINPTSYVYISKTGSIEGNEKSRRVQEKLGFVYHHTTDGLEVKLMHEIRT